MSDMSMNSEQQELTELFWQANRLLNHMSDYEIKTVKDDFFTGREYTVLQGIKSKAIERIKAIDQENMLVHSTALSEVEGV